MRYDLDSTDISVIPPMTDRPMGKPIQRGQWLSSMVRSETTEYIRSNPVMWQCFWLQTYVLVISRHQLKGLINALRQKAQLAATWSEDQAKATIGNSSTRD